MRKRKTRVVKVKGGLVVAGMARGAEKFHYVVERKWLFWWLWRGAFVDHERAIEYACDLATGHADIAKRQVIWKSAARGFARQERPPAW